MAIDGISSAQAGSLVTSVLNGQLLAKTAASIEGPNGPLGKVEDLKSNLIDAAAEIVQAALESNTSIDIKA